MSKSIMPYNLKGVCYICHAHCQTDVHHIFEGSNRKASDDYGLTIDICRVCHRDIHRNPKKYEWLKEKAQIFAMQYKGWTIDQWRKLFRKNYRGDID